MTTEFIWHLPTGGDGRYGDAARTRRGERTALGPGVTDLRGARFNYFDYLHQVARAADVAGFDGIQIAQEDGGDDAWIIAGYVARGTRRLKLLTEFDAAWGSAVYAAKNAVSFQRATGGRLAWKIGRGPDAATRQRDADPVGDADISSRIEQFVTVARGVQTSAPYDFKGRFFEVQGGGFRGPLAGNPLPQVYLEGDDDEAFALSARQADVHVLAARSLDALRPAIERLQALTRAEGRSVTVALRINLLARETEEEAVRDGALYWQQSGFGDAPTSAGFWAANSALVGSYQQVQDALLAYIDAGIGSFLLGAVPHLEEAYRIGEHVLPQLRQRLAPAQAA